MDPKEGVLNIRPHAGFVPGPNGEDWPWGSLDCHTEREYFKAVTHPNCTPDEIRGIVRKIARERGWEMKP